MIYKEIIEKAAKKAAVKAWDTIGISDKYGKLENQTDRRYWKNKYLRELWKHCFMLGNRELLSPPVPGREMRERISASLKDIAKDDCIAIGTQSWISVKLAHHSYILSEGEGATLVTAHNATAQPTLMSAEDTARLIVAFDDFLTQWEQRIDEALLAYSSDKKTRLLLKMTASAILEDILTENDGIDFRMSLQKNGKLKCTIIRKASWLPDKVFRTTWEDLRSDFVEALKDYYTRQNKAYIYQ